MCSILLFRDHPRFSTNTPRVGTPQWLALIRVHSYSLGPACRLSQSAVSCAVKGVLGQNPKSALGTQGISCLHRDYNLIFSLFQNSFIFTGMHGVFPNYPLASLPFFCMYHFLICLFVWRRRRSLWGEMKCHARQFCSPAAVPSLFCQSRGRLLLPVYNTWP